MKQKIGWQGHNESLIGVEDMRSGRLVGAANISKKFAERRMLQRKNLSILGIVKKREWPQCHRESSWQQRQSCLCQKEKKQNRLFKALDCTIGESQGKREPHLGEINASYVKLASLTDDIVVFENSQEKSESYD